MPSFENMFVNLLCKALKNMYQRTRKPIVFFTALLFHLLLSFPPAFFTGKHYCSSMAMNHKRQLFRLYSLVLIIFVFWQGLLFMVLSWVWCTGNYESVCQKKIHKLKGFVYQIRHFCNLDWSDYNRLFYKWLPTD